MKHRRDTGHSHAAHGVFAGAVLVLVGVTGCTMEPPVEAGMIETPSVIDDCRDGSCMTKLIDSGNIIASGSNATPCASPADCASGFCVDGVCCDAACTSFCQACTASKKGSGVDGVCGFIASGTDPDNECLLGNCNGSGGCMKIGIGGVLLGNGASCTMGSQCSSGSCVDGVCCNSACTSTCQACTAAKKGSGSDGICGNIAAATDPDNECALGNCNGAGICGGSMLLGNGSS